MEGSLHPPRSRTTPPPHNLTTRRLLPHDLLVDDLPFELGDGGYRGGLVADAQRVPAGQLLHALDTQMGADPRQFCSPGATSIYITVSPG